MNLVDHEVDENLLALHRTKDFEHCIDASREILKKNPLHLQALLYIAELGLEQRDNLEECIHCCDTILQGVDDRIYPVWTWKGQALCLQKKYKEAEQCFMEALTYAPTDTSIWSFVAISMYMQDKKDLAIALLDMAEEKCELHGQFSLVRGYLERAEGNTDDALLQFIQGSMQVDPTSKDYEESKELYAEEIAKTIQK